MVSQDRDVLLDPHARVGLLKEQLPRDVAAMPLYGPNEHIIRTQGAGQARVLKPACKRSSHVGVVRSLYGRAEGT